MIAALVLALVVGADPCAEAPPACRAAAASAITTWRTTADLRAAALERCTVELRARTATASLALALAAASERPAEPGYGTGALLAAGAGGAALGAVLGVIIGVLARR